MQYYGTLFDINYLSRGLTLVHSLKTESLQPFVLYILGLDEAVVNYFVTYPDKNVEVIPLKDIEAKYPELSEVKKTRKFYEYYFTLSPFLPLYILEKFKGVDQITTLDADLFFYDDPAKITDHYKDYSVLITPHAFSDKMKSREFFGKYNVSFQSFKNDQYGLACLKGWAAKCIDWCFDYYDKENNRFADQKYLDTWHTDYEKVADIDMKGTGIAPWNIEKNPVQLRNNKPYVGNDPLIFYHFHYLRKINKYFYSHGFNLYQVQDRKTPMPLYREYVKNLMRFDNTNRSDLAARMHIKKSGLYKTLMNTDGYYFFNPLFSTELSIVGSKKKWNARLKRTAKIFLKMLGLWKKPV